MAGKEIIIIGGPNGAGKTTAARKFLPHVIRRRAFLNADEIARQLAPDDPESAAFAAGRQLLRQLNEFVQSETSFAIETTCSGKSYVPVLKRCVENGWKIIFYYLWLPSPENSVARVANRVREGGHFIPREDIQRRFIPGL